MMGLATRFMRRTSGKGADHSIRAWSITKYRPLTTIPDAFESILIEDANGPGPYGAKFGRSGIIPVAPAVANAVAWCPARA